MSSSTLPTKIGIILFPGFQLLDATGPLDAFSLLSQQHPLEICILGATLAPITTAHAMQASGASIVPTHTFAQAKELGLDVLVLPGGLGTRTEANVSAVVEFVKSLGVGGVGWMLTVCTGSEVLARTGWLDGRRATTNKRAFNEVHSPFHFSPLVPRSFLPRLSCIDVLMLHRSGLNTPPSTGSPERAGSSTAIYGPAAGFLQVLIWPSRGSRRCLARR